MSVKGYRKTYVLTFTGIGVTAGSLADGRYILRLYAGRVQDQYGLPLSGSDSILTFHRFFGDSDGDGDVDTTDLALFRGSLNKRSGETGYLACFDFDGKGTVDVLDYNQLRMRLGKRIQ